MLILKHVCQSILSHQRETPPETGGILGGRDGVVTEYRLDEGKHIGKMCSYAPNVALLNETIRQWQGRGIAFMGIFHTHFFGVDTLSDGDMDYIETIMKQMPPQIDRLLFPLVVMPQREIAAYSAIIRNGEVVISKDQLELIERIKEE